MHINYSNASAVAHIRGNGLTPYLSGKVEFYQRDGYIWVIAKISGLPKSQTGFFAIHIHDGESCNGEGFPNSGVHYNPNDVPHPIHAGDLPPLLSCDGKAYMAVMTDRFSVDEIRGKVVIIHDGTDDFKSQPSGNSGEKIGCGVIQ